MQPAHKLDAFRITAQDRDGIWHQVNVRLFRDVNEQVCSYSTHTRCDGGAVDISYQKILDMPKLLRQSKPVTCIECMAGESSSWGLFTEVA